MTICNFFVISRFDFEGGIWVLIAAVPGFCILDISLDLLPVETRNYIRSLWLPLLVHSGSLKRIELTRIFNVFTALKGTRLYILFVFFKIWKVDAQPVYLKVDF